MFGLPDWGVGGNTNFSTSHKASTLEKVLLNLGLQNEKKNNCTSKT
jgi:hypothetical protein